MPEALTKKRILELLDKLNTMLSKQRIHGELYLVGGAVMCLAFEARASTGDIDAQFIPQKAIRPLVRRIAEQEGLDKNWLNDAVKGFFSEKPAFQKFLDLDHLKVFVPEANYLLAMKCLAMRIGPEFQDEADVRYLLRYLNVSTYQEAVDIISKFYPLDRFPQKTLYALEEILDPQEG